jgi:hypothetical protein
MCFFVFFDDSKIWDSEGFLKFRLSDASDYFIMSNIFLKQTFFIFLSFKEIKKII